jgi:MFS family permease
LTAGTKPSNVVGLFVINFLVTVVLYIKSAIITYLLVADYNVSQHDAGQVAGKLGLYATIVIIPCELSLGTLSDLIGRKKLIIFGLALVGLSMILMTRFHHVYP